VKQVEIRRATIEDAATVARIHVRGWQWAYRGLIPDAFLDALSIEQREPVWRQQLAPDHPWHTWIAEVNGDARAFVTCGPTRDASLAAETGEVYALYQEENSAGTGVGRALLSHAMSDLRAQGFAAGILWVLEGNHRARRFYEAAGWTPDGARKEDHRADHVRQELRYRTELVP
jgi:GNAT superfamily N-acetyltransferase